MKMIFWVIVCFACGFLAGYTSERCFGWDWYDWELYVIIIPVATLFMLLISLVVWW